MDIWKWWDRESGTDGEGVFLMAVGRVRVSCERSEGGVAVIENESRRIRSQFRPIRSLTIDALTAYTVGGGNR